MAYMNQEKKSVIAAALKKVVPAGWKYTLAVRNHSTIVFTLRQAPVDILGNIREAIEAKQFGYGHKAPEVGLYWRVNTHYIDSQFSGDVLAVFQKIDEALNTGNHDNSDIQTDYFDVGWYVDLNVGSYGDPFLDTVPAPVSAPKVVQVPKKAYLKYRSPNYESMTTREKWNDTYAAYKKYMQEQGLPA